MTETEPLALPTQGAGCMPNKTIYVSDGDLPVFERAQELAGGNLSATIAQALHGLIEREDLGQRGFEEVTVEVGMIVHVPKRFVGRSLANGKVGGRGRSHITTYAVYLTQKSRYALHVRTEPNWQAGDPDWDEPIECRLDVFESLDELKELVPEELYDAALAATGDIRGEFLDI